MNRWGLEMRATSSFGSLLLLFTVGAWSRSADTDHVEPNSFHYGGWRPIRGRSLYSRNNSQVRQDDKQNLYVVVPTALINLGHVPVNHQLTNNEVTAESQVREQRVRFPNPHPDAEPSPNLALLRPRHPNIHSNGEHEHVEESQNKQIYHQGRPPVPVQEPEASHVHQDPRIYQSNSIPKGRHPQHLEPSGRFKPKKIPPPPRVNLAPGPVRAQTFNEHRNIVQQNFRTFVGAGSNLEREPAELEAQGTRQLGIRIRYQKNEEQKDAGQQSSKQSLKHSINPEPSKANLLPHHHFVVNKDAKHRDFPNKIQEQERGESTQSLSQIGAPNKLPEVQQHGYIVSKPINPNGSPEDNQFPKQQRPPVRLFQQATTVNVLQPLAPPTRSSNVQASTIQSPQHRPVISQSLNFSVLSPQDANQQAKENGPIYKKPVEFSRGSAQESTSFDRFLQATNANRGASQHETFTLPLGDIRLPQSSQTVFQQTVNGQIQFGEESAIRYNPLSFQNASDAIQSENAPVSTYFPHLPLSSGKQTIITNDLYGRPLVPPPALHRPPVAESETCEPKCAPKRTASFEEITERITLARIMERHLAGSLFRLVPLQEDSLIKLISAGGPYTLFLPSDEAIGRLPQQLIEKWQKNPQALMFALLNHAIPSKETIDGLLRKRVLDSKAAGAILYANDYRNETVTVNGKRVAHADIPAPQNGIVHVIDGMLFPAADKNIASVVAVCDRFDGFLNLAEISDVISILRRDGPFTLFLPSNDALMKIEKDDMDFMRSNITVMKEFLLYHIVDGLYYSGDLLDGQYLPTLLPGHSLKAGVRVDGCYRRLVEANNSPVYRSDIPARNGVIHVVDWVIRPSDLDWCDGILLP